MTSIRHRLLALLLGVIAAMSAVHAFVTWRIARDEAREQSDLQLRQAAVLVLRGRFAPADRPAAPPARLDPRSELLVRIDDDASRWASHPEDVLPTPPADGYATVRTPAGPLRVYSLRVGARTVRVGQYEWVRDAYARRAALRNLAPMAVVVPALMLLAWAVVVRSLRPLDALAARLRERAPDAGGPIGEAGLPRELKPVARALDGLLARVDEMVAMQRAFVADAAHELRTPVTALGLQLDLVRRTPPGPERELRLQRLEDGVARASRMVAQLLALARVDGADPAVDAAPVDLAAVCRDAASAALGLADAAGSTIEADLPETPWTACVRGDRQQLESLAGNLIENALRHAPGGTVRIAVATREAEVRLAVVDQGPGIPASLRAQALERFTRLAGAPAGGSGLGLAIVRGIAKRHGGEVTLMDGEGPRDRPGLRVCVTLPAARPFEAAPHTPPR